MSATFIKINNSKEAAIKSGKWSDPGAKLYDTLLNSHDSRWNVNGRNVFPEDDEAETWDYWQDFLKEAYLIAPTKDIKNSPYGKTPFSNSGCKYPHHIIKKGELVVSIPGLKAAYIRACQQGVMKGEIKDHIERHIKELGIEASFHNGQLTWNESHEIKIEENFNSIYDYIQENTGIDLHDDYELFNENWLIIKKDFNINIDQWNTGNPLWITGASGDGKSTIAESIAKDNNALVITSDIVLCRMSWSKEKFENKMNSLNSSSEPNPHKMVFKDSPAIDYVLSHPNLPYNAKDPNTKCIDSKITTPYMIDFYKWLMKELSSNPKYKNNLYVIEGCDICLLDPKLLIDKPLIIVGGSRLRSLWRRAKRNSGEHSSESMIESVFKYIKKYNLENRRLDDNKDIFRKNIKKAIKQSKNSYIQEASHGKLKYDFRMGWDYNTGHQIKVVYSLDNINITDIGDFYYNYNGKKDGATHDSHLDYTRKNITRKGNTDHQSKGQKVLAIEDIATGERLTSVKLLNPFCRYIDTRATVQTKDNLEKARKYADNENPSCLTQLTVGQIDNTPSFKSTHWASKVMDKATGENLRFNKIAKSEMLKHGRGHKVNNINAKDFPVFGDNHKYMTYHNPNKKQALNELYMRERDIINYINHLKSDSDLNDPKIQSSYQAEMNNLRIIQRDINTIQNGKYDLSMMKKYRSYDEAVDAGLSGNQTLDYSTYMDYRPSMQSIADEYINDYLQEASHGKLKYDFREVYDYDTGHSLKIVYSLDNIKVTDIGGHYLNDTYGNNSGDYKKKVISDIQKNIRRKGSPDHQSTGQKVLAIIDRVTNKKLTTARTFGPYSPIIKDCNINLSFNDLQLKKEELDKLHKECNNKGQSYINSKVYRITVGEIDNSLNFKSTKWYRDNIGFLYKGQVIVPTSKESKKDAIQAIKDGQDGLSMYNNNNEMRTAGEHYKHGRGAKMDDIDPDYGKTLEEIPRWKHPSKKELARVKKMNESDDYKSHIISSGNLSQYAISDEELEEVRNRSFNEHSENALEGDAELTMTSRIFDETGKTPQSIFNWIRENIEYDNESPDKWKLKSIGETYYHSKGNCHDQSLFSTSLFHSLGIITGQLFFIEYNDGEEVGGNTHTLTWYRNKDNIKQYYWVETAWETQAGIHGPYSSIDDMKKDIHNRWKKEFGEKWDDIEFSDTSNYHLGMTLDQYVQSWVFKDVETLIKESLDWIDSFVHDEVFREEASSDEENSEVETQEEVTDDNPPSIDDNAGSGESNEKPSEDHTKDDGNIEDEQVDEEPQSEDNKSNKTEEEPEKEVKEEKPVSRPKQTDAAEKDKNGVRRKKLYIAFIEWCKEYNSKNTFGSIFDKDAFNVSYPFVPKEMRYFYRLANPMLCVLSGNLTFFPVAELRKLNSKNSHLDQMMIFAATEEDVRVFNRKDKKIYKGIEENGTLKLSEVLSDTFDLYIQNMIKKGDILNGPIEDENSSEENK